MDCEWIGWCALKPEAQAAWVQAVGSVAAIVVPITLYLGERAQRRAAERRNRATFVAQLRPVLRRFQGKMRVYVLQNGPYEEGEVLDVSRLNGEYEQDIPALLNLVRQAPPVPSLDEKLTQLAHRIEDLQSFIDQINDMMGGGLHSAWINNVDDVLRMASIVDDLASAILDEITPRRL